MHASSYTSSMGHRPTLAWQPRLLPAAKKSSAPQPRALLSYSARF